MMKTIKHILIAGLAFVVMLIVLDVFIQQAGIENTSLTRYDYTLGKIRPAEKSYIIYNEGFSLGQFNQGGYMHAYYPPRDGAEAGVLRVALFGDSYVEGFQVFQKDHFATLVEEGLQAAHPDKRIEVLNFGYSGFDIGDMYVYSQVIAAPYHPDVFVFMLSKSDLQLNYRMTYSPRVEVDSTTLQITRPYTKEKIARYNQSKALLNYSALANMLNKARKASEQDILTKCLDKFYQLEGPKAAVYDEKSIHETDSLGTASRLILEELQGHLVFVNRDDTPLPQSICAEVEHLGIPYVDLSVPLQKLYDAGINPHYWEVTNKLGHWNKSAHRAVADYMVREFPSCFLVEE